MNPYLLLVVGFIGLVKGADFFVSGSSTIAKALRIPSLIIGLTIVAFGTSAPEAAVSITAAISGSNDIALGNILGSNVFNLLVVVGCSALFQPVRVDDIVMKRDYPFGLLAAAMLLLLGWGGSIHANGQLSRVDGLLLLAVFVVFMYGMLRAALRSRAATPALEDEPVAMSLKGAAIVSVLGAAAIIIGGKCTVTAATEIARSWGVSEALIGLTIVAIGTSLPELVTSIMAARKGESDIALGNAIGSNIFNVFFILGSSAAIHPLAVPAYTLVDMAFLVVMSLLVYWFAHTGKRVSRSEGMVMILFYVLYTVYICMR